MLENTTYKIKRFAEIGLKIAIAVSCIIIFAGLLETQDYRGEEAGIIMMCLGIFLFFTSWLGGLLLKGFCEIIENTDKIANSLTADKGKSEQEEKLRKLDYWKEWNLINDKEYEILKNRLTSPEDMLYTVKKKYDDGEITEQQYKEMRIKVFNSLFK